MVIVISALVRDFRLSKPLVVDLQGIVLCVLIQAAAGIIFLVLLLIVFVVFARVTGFDGKSARFRSLRRGLDLNEQDTSRKKVAKAFIGILVAPWSYGLFYVPLLSKFRVWDVAMYGTALLVIVLAGFAVLLLPQPHSLENGAISSKQISVLKYAVTGFVTAGRHFLIALVILPRGLPTLVVGLSLSKALGLVGASFVRSLPRPTPEMLAEAREKAMHREAEKQPKWYERPKR